MKKIFWTTVFWLVLIFLFRSYLRLFDKDLWVEIWSRFGRTNTVCVTANTWQTAIDEQLNVIQTQLDIISQKIEKWNNSEYLNDNGLSTSTPTDVKLFYFNQKEDQKLPIWQQINIDSILPVTRTIAKSNNIIQDTINQLIQWSITNSEKDKWFMTEFPNRNFQLVSSELKADWTLILEFTEVPGFTDGWSARMLILANSISKTAMQFPQVRRVQFIPNTLFQP